MRGWSVGMSRQQGVTWVCQAKSKMLPMRRPGCLLEHTSIAAQVACHVDMLITRFES